MFFQCQQDSYEQVLKTKVVSCESVEECGSDEPGLAFDIVLQDTIIFPGGGGQPKDEGSIDMIPIEDVVKKNDVVYHRISKPMAVGSLVTVTLCWAKRFDHMQQHTGQHLVTALAETHLNYSTTAWNMGRNISCIELDTEEIDTFDVEMLESRANDAIRECKPITVEYYKEGDPALASVSKRLELPEDHCGVVRVVNIEGIDANTCCGTHVRNTSDLQIIKLLYMEKAKRNRTNLFFVVGDRVLKYLKSSVNRERHLIRRFGCTPEEQLVFVERNYSNLKNAERDLRAILRDVAMLEAKLFKTKDPVPSYYCLHRSNGTLDYMAAFLREVDCNRTLFVLTVGGPHVGHMIMSGPLLLIENIGPQVCSLLDGKGCLQNGKLQAKIKMANVPKINGFLRNVDEEIETYFDEQ